MSAHTPGPWVYNTKLAEEAEKYTEMLTSRVDTDLFEPICIIPHDDICDSGYEEVKANARLIAAAPEMFELLKDIGIGELTPSIMNRIENLIQKIEGESPHDPERTRDKNE